LLRSLLRNQGNHPETITTDKLPSYGAAVRELGLNVVHRPGGLQANNRAENSHPPIHASDVPGGGPSGVGGSDGCRLIKGREGRLAIRRS